ncbi:hypothetical protein GE061_010910 [Apolygus lucorum]|uniref:LRRNT domain-containing protein n=1 Tax=Apolygus lucorum TaxID=248454 RepID=A0A8S9XX62_APOLU|nr:hypothetical protein GE061_010910 [Apolygus lucorum]
MYISFYRKLLNKRIIFSTYPATRTSRLLPASPRKMDLKLCWLLGSLLAITLCGATTSHKPEEDIHIESNSTPSSKHFTTTTTPSSQSPGCPTGCRCSVSFTGPKLVCDFLDPEIQEFGTTARHLVVNGKRGDHAPKLAYKYFFKAGLANLVTLTIRNASLSKIDRGAFEGMDHLEELDLSDNEIVTLHPNTIENNGNLRHLILRNNPGIQLTNPNSPRHTPFLVSGSLVQLILANCQIKDIPKRAFANLGGLDYLDLSGNYLTELKDDGLAELINLETLDVSDNSISKISADAFVDIDDLTTLYLRGNPIKTLEGIEISGLEELDASRCDIEVLSPAVFDGFPELVLLNLSMNKIKDIDDEAFLALTALRYLDLSHNSIRSPPRQIHVPKLQ